MKVLSAIFFICIFANVFASDCPAKKTTSKLICYYSKLTHVDSCKCSHVILPADADVKSIDRIRQHIKGVKILITVNEFNQGLVNILKSSKVDGIEINLKKLDSKNDINDFISTVRSKLGSDLYIVLSVPAKTESLAKYYDFKSLSKNADLFILQTAFLGASKNVTFHPSRLSGLWDMQNTDSVVDLVSGLGAPLSKLVITAPVQAFKFKLQSEKHTAPGSPALEIQSITRNELCEHMGNGGNWTLERDQDQTGSYIFSKDQWIAFDDHISVDIKAKYARVRGLAGMALKDLSQDGGTKCESSILNAAYNGLSRQARAPRGAVLHSLEREILETPARPLDSIQVSPYRISRVIDVEGSVHVIRKDTRTEFECSRQGYFVHPRSCGRFYRCVKFDQLSDEFSVFEFDCPAGLAFDSRVEVCVWPGSLSHGSACTGSSEIAPVPRERFVCPHEQGYYADPENCRWFFACLDHGKSPLSAYEFRCPFGLVYDESRLLCEWPWLVPKCGNGYAVGSEVVYGGAGSVAIDQYDGLGVLRVTSLGGLHGPLQQPVAQTYSNVGLVSQGNNYLTDGGQLSLKASQSLQNAGLLKTEYAGNTNLHGVGYTVGAVDGNIGITTAQVNGGLGYAVGGADGYVGIKTAQANEAGIGYTVGAAEGNVGVKTTHADGAGLVYTQGSDALLTGTHGNDFGVRLHQVGGLGIGNSQSYNSQLNTVYRGDGYVHNAGVYGAQLGNTASKLQSNYVEHGTNLNYQTGSLLTGSGHEGAVGIQSSGDYAGTTNAHLVNGLAGNLHYQQQAIGVAAAANNAAVSGYDAAKSTVEYHGNTGSAYESGTNGNINIVGGGYSAVGVASGGVHVTNYGEDSNLVTHVTQSPISVSTVSSIPTVTSVPVPALNVASGFQSFKGGVVANVPELQYKVHSSRGSFGVANVSNSFVNVVSSTPSTLFRNDGYNYPKPTVAFVEDPVKSTVFTGTTYVQENLANVQPIITGYQRPVVISTTQNPLIEPVVPTYQKPVSTSFVQHVKPAVTTYEKQLVTAQVPIVQQQINVQPVVTTYQKPVFVSTTPAPVVVEKLHIQQPVVSTYNVQKQDTSFVGYDYPKPAVKFEETPVKTNGGSFSYQNLDLVHKTEGYIYSKPAVAFEEVPTKTVNQAYVSTFTQSSPAPFKAATVYDQVQPVAQVQPTIHTVIKQQPLQHQLELTSYNVPSSTVRPVVVEQPQVYVSSTPAVPVVKQQSGISFTNNFQNHEIVQPQLQVTSYNVPSSTLKPIVFEQPQVYVSSTPAPFVKEHAAVSFTNYQKHETVQPQIDLVSYNIPSSTVTQVVQQKVVQPAIVSSFSISSNNGGYHYEKPNVVFEEKPSVVTYQQPAIQKTVIASQPVVSSYNYQAAVPVKPAVNTYTYKNVLQSAVSQGYDYPKPAIAFEEVPASVTKLTFDQRPVVSRYNYVAPSTVKPAVISSYNYVAPVKQLVSVQKQTPVVTSYTYTAPSTIRPADFVQQPVVYNYIQSSTPKTAIFLQKQPAVVSSYSYVAPSTVKPAVIAQPVVTYTPKPVIFKKQPAVVSSYSFNSQPVKTEFSGYDYSKPAVSFVEQPASVVTSYENRQPVEEVPFVAKKAYVTGNQGGSYQYTQQFNHVQAEQKPLVVENYQVPVSTTPLYEYKEPVVVSTSPKYEYRQEYSADSGYVYGRPSVAFEDKRINYEIPLISKQVPSGSYYYDNTAQVVQKVVNSTPRPIDYTYIQSTPRPTFKSLIASRPFKFYDSRLVSTAKPVTYTTSSPIIEETVSTSRPVSRYSFSSFGNQYEQVKNVEDYVAPIEVSTPSRVQVDVAPSIVTTSRPIAKYSFSSFDSQYQQGNLGKVVESYVAPVEVTTPSREYLPVDVTPSVSTESYVLPIKVTTSAPALAVTREYLPVRSRVKVTSAPEIAVPSREYLPVRSRVRVTTPLSTDVDELIVNKKPIRVHARPKTIVKVNDFHPLLPAKLGAQCTCVSNSVRLRKKPVRIIVDDDDGDDGYAVDDNEGAVVVENYQYEPQRVVDITPTPEVYIKSTTSGIIEPSPTPVFTRRRVRVRPATSTVAYESPVTEAAQLFRKAATVDDGLEGVAVNAVDSVQINSEERVGSHKFDRYGPGGWRSRDEKLQGTIDCQRAGLFRHPSQCNKFYACRWDCTKNRFTLHVFNCPVHLTFDNNLGACNWPSQGPACLENTLLPSD